MSNLLQERVSERIRILKEKFDTLPTPEDRYSYIIELGRALPLFPEELRKPELIVPGCQSILYLNTTLINEYLIFTTYSDSLISAGLAAILTSIYSNATPKEILLTPPSFLHELGIFASLSPNRSNGLASIYTRIKQDSLTHLINSK